MLSRWFNSYFHPQPKRLLVLFWCTVVIALIDWAIRFDFIPVPHAVCNTGIALGITLESTILWSGIVLLLGMALYQSWTQSVLAVRLAWFVIFMGGGVNALDRGFHGCVKDYLSLPYFPSFNFADMMLFLGVIYLLWMILGRKPKDYLYVS